MKGKSDTAKLRARIKGSDIPGLWHEVVLTRDRGLCRLCGDKAQEVHHINGKRSLGTAYDPRNGISLCIPCHKKAWLVLRWLEEHQPKWYAWIVADKRAIRHNRDIDLNRIRAKLKAA